MVQTVTRTRPEQRTAAEIVRDLARVHGIRHERSELDDFGHTVAKLSDADVELDDTEWLIVALMRAKVISSEDGMALSAAHLRQKAA
ncbi:hypothetical protein ACFW16_32740 [Inquilinus sp. NPDC058860]|uniref:hypothetical protein n=1 Tax=Inquilinus sp. NPDC058860 TaxID=3346652 RepID=UPI0036B156CF